MIKLKKVTPMFNKIITTAEFTEELSESGIITNTKKSVDEFQTVIAVGDSVRSIKVGDVVCVDPNRYAVRKYKKDSVKADIEEYANTIIDYEIPLIILDGVKHLMIMDSDVLFIVDDYEKIEPTQIIDNTKVLM